MKKTIEDVKIAGQIVLVRVDYNVPLSSPDATEPDDTGDSLSVAGASPRVTSDLRVRASLPTINYLVEHKAKKIILISHLGRPEGRDKSLSLRPVAEVLAGLLPGQTVSFVDDVSGPEVESAAAALPEGGILLLENLRFSPLEEQDSEDYAREIVDSVHADLFVQDGFAVIHRAHASTDAITRLLPSVAGLLVEKEISTLSKVSSNPERPLTLVLGGSKVEDKQPLINKFAALADHICIGGKIAADGFTPPAEAQIYVATDFDEDSEGHKLDIGPLSTAKITEIIQNSKTVIWNGLLGKAEDPAFATSSTIVAKALGENPSITSVICGGDTTGFVEEQQAEEPNLKYTLVSTGGGAALEFLIGKPLPGYEALEDK